MSSSADQVRTVLGEVPAVALGRTDYHEHLFQVSPLLPGDELDDEPASQAEAASFRGSGFATLVDATPTGLGRRPSPVGVASTIAAKPEARKDAASTRLRGSSSSSSPGSSGLTWNRCSW